MIKTNKFGSICRKPISQILALMIILAGMLAGCGNVQIDDDLKDDLQENVEAISTPACEVTRMHSTPILTIEMKSNDYCDIDGILCSQVNYDMVSLEGYGFETVAQAISEWNDRDIERLEQVGEEYADYGADVIFTSDVTCTRMDNSIISFKQRRIEKLTNTHELYSGVNFDVISGKRMVLSDIFADEEDFIEKLTECILDKTYEMLDAEERYREYKVSISSALIQEYAGMDNMWYLDAEGIVFLISPYINEDEFLEDIMVTVPYEDMAEYMKAEYCGMHGAGVARFPVNRPIRVNLSNAGINWENSTEELAGTKLLEWDTVMLTHEEFGGYVNIIVNDRHEEVEQCWEISDVFLLYQVDNMAYLLFDMRFEGDYHATYLYDISDGEIRMTENLAAEIVDKSVNVRSLTLIEREDVFGTHFSRTDYTLRDEGGRLICTEMRYFDNDLNDSLNVIRELPVVIDGEVTSLKPGSQIMIIGIDDSETAYFEEINTGIEGEIHYTREDENSDGAIYVDGMRDDYYFDYLPYSG